FRPEKSPISKKGASIARSPFIAQAATILARVSARGSQAGVAPCAVIAPYVTSAIAKYTGSYNTVFILTTVLLLIGVVLTLITKK
ncbi:hypothetical protein MJH54_28980, partial [Salmonella enterica subsp. enterica serovar Montevideo]|nr:hypothetical protein [Salmonella enterica subsp. enterica serovar Montevideo]